MWVTLAGLPVKVMPWYTCKFLDIKTVIRPIAVDVTMRGYSTTPVFNQNCWNWGRKTGFRHSSYSCAGIDPGNHACCCLAGYPQEEIEHCIVDYQPLPWLYNTQHFLANQLLCAHSSQVLLNLGRFSRGGSNAMDWCYAVLKFLRVCVSLDEQSSQTN